MTPNDNQLGGLEQELIVGRQKIRFSREATIALYREVLRVPDADRCGCLSCKNFASQRGAAYPEEFLQLLDGLGIDPQKEWEAFDYDFEQGNVQKHLDGRWFVFCGELIEGIDVRPESDQATFAFWFTSSFPAVDLPAGIKTCAVEFIAPITWVNPELS